MHSKPQIPPQFQRYHLTPVPFVPPEAGRVERIGALYSHFGTQIRTRAGFHVGGPVATKALLKLALAHASAIPLRILDLCSGVGPSVRALQETLGAVVVRADLVIDQLKPTRGALCVGADAMSLPFRAGAFDIVWCEDAFSHVPDREKLLSECHRVLRQGGYLVFSDLTCITLPAKRAAIFTDAWCLARLETPDSYRRLLDDLGFRALAIDSRGREMIAAHVALESSIGDARAGEYNRWIRSEAVALRMSWGQHGVDYQRTRLRMYEYLESGQLDHTYVVARR